MIDKLIETSLKKRFLVLAFFVGLAGWGYGPWSIRRSMQSLTSATTR